MEPELRDLLRTVSSDNDKDSYSHVTLYGPQAHWTIRHQSQTVFWTGYCDLIQRRGAMDSKAHLCLAERTQEVAPLIANLTFRFQVDANDEGDWEPYTDDFLQQLCQAYQTILTSEFRIISETQMELVVVVLESTTHWFEEDERNPGQRYMILEVRLQFPYGRIDRNLQSRVIRPRVIQELRRRNLLGRLERQPMGDWDQIISNDYQAPVILYGSGSVAELPKLQLSHIWGQIDLDNLGEGIPPDEIPLEDVFIPQNHILYQQQVLDVDIFNGNHDLSHWLPLFLSVGYWPTVLLPIRQATVSNTPSSTRPFGEGNRDFSDQGEMELAEQMIGMIDKRRLLQESFWLDIGKALYMADQGGENGVLSWIHHGERACQGVQPLPAFLLPSVAVACRDLYSTFATAAISIKTLAWYAREDTPERYAAWHREWCLASMEQALSCYHTDVAIVLHRVYWLDFLYSPIGRGRWFQFRNHRWSEVNQGIELRKAISRDFMRRFEAARAVLSRQIHDSHDESFKSKGEITMKKLTVLIGKLKSVPFKSSIMTEACEHFSDSRFISLLDVNPHITGLTNGVLETVGHYVVFRAAKPEDYVSMCTNIPYQANYSWKHPLVQEAMKWLGQVFTDEKLLHHFLKFSASCLRGRNSDKIFPIWTGEGDNSKSMIVKLFECALGSYCIKFPVALLTEKVFNSSGPTPQLARAKSTRVAFLDEPEDDVQMHKGTIKRYTGGDSFFARLLQENGDDVKATFKMILMCNKVPVIPNADRAIKNRTRLFPFMSTWVPDPPKDEAEQYRQRLFQMNTDFEKRIPVLAPAFLWIMSEYFPHYSVEGLKDPAIVIETTEAYWRDNDVYAQFAADAIQEVLTTEGVRDTSIRATLSEIYTEFKVWFREAFPGTKVPERSVVRNELSTRWGRMHGTSWLGIRITRDEYNQDLSAALGGRSKAAIAKPNQEPLEVINPELKLIEPRRAASPIPGPRVSIAI